MSLSVLHFTPGRPIIFQHQLDVAGKHYVLTIVFLCLIQYCHRGATAPVLVPREDVTTMGTMTTGPFREDARYHPASPPRRYKERDRVGGDSSVTNIQA